ncbi:DUF3800 domain-containing protein [Rathayibacter sp. VKM Ac-2927]|uniref:DUF3800 domain-containing protein n=1 Tax=Rathayibacter sp. VKM Ac-2927 TaxID=2929478 RepID=UPI001FB1EE73|nr:DUF3800 domain-containing protein [Rathayibacter sp. VKM Ac-2927]MCJ1688759.1 hypothetical protein [Rathayibacter sp. VKM Ac-2927]
MLIVYVDEFGNHTLDRDEAAGEPALRRGASQYFVLGYVGVRDTSRRALAERIMEVKEKHFGHSAAGGLPWADSEIKGRHLRRVARSVATGHHLDRPAAYRTLTTEKHTAALFKDIGLLFDTFRPPRLRRGGGQARDDRDGARTHAVGRRLRIPASACRSDRG